MRPIPIMNPIAKLKSNYDLPDQIKPKGSRQKKRSFYGQADRKGGSAPSALTVSKCENFGQIFPIIKW